MRKGIILFFLLATGFIFPALSYANTSLNHDPLIRFREVLTKMETGKAERTREARRLKIVLPSEIFSSRITHKNIQKAPVTPPLTQRVTHILPRHVTLQHKMANIVHPTVKTVTSSRRMKRREHLTHTANARPFARTLQRMRLFKQKRIREAAARNISLPSQGGTCSASSNYPQLARTLHHIIDLAPAGNATFDLI